MSIVRNAAILLAAALTLAACQSGSLVKTSATVRDGLASAELSKTVGFFNRSKALRAEYQALEYGATGAPVSWNGGGIRRGNVIPGPIYQVNTFDCRDYSHTVFVEADATVAKGTACRQPDGSWKLVS